jgi:pilus assembly protein TadC
MMPTLPTLLDGLLLTLAGLTAALILYKAVELYTPGLIRRRRPESALKNALELDECLERLERALPLLATIAAIAPFLGLAATVMHIRSALTLIGGSAPDTGIIAGPIAQALSSTLLGLASAIPAAAAYNFFARRLQLIENRVRRRLASRSAEDASLFPNGLPPIVERRDSQP